MGLYLKLMFAKCDKHYPSKSSYSSNKFHQTCYNDLFRALQTWCSYIAPGKNDNLDQGSSTSICLHIPFHGPKDVWGAGYTRIVAPSFAAWACQAQATADGTTICVYLASQGLLDMSCGAIYCSVGLPPSGMSIQMCPPSVTTPIVTFWLQWQNHEVPNGLS